MEHYWLGLPGPVWFSGADLYRRYVESVSGPSIAVELGAWKGRSTCFMGVEVANSGKPISFYTVDHWEGVADEEGYDADADEVAGRLFDVFSANIAPVESHINILSSDSAAAANGFADEAVDFLYLDASHTYQGVLRDLAAWFPKVKTGGVIAGDDWCFSVRGELTVRNAVIDFFGKDASRIRVENGSAPNNDWLQWSIVKSSDLKACPRAVLAFRRARRVLMRSFLFRGAASLVRRLKPTS